MTDLDRATDGATDRAAARLARADLEPVVDELVRRLGDSDATPVRITLRDLEPRTRAALADLLGTPRLPPATGRLDVARLASALALPDRDAIRGVVEVLRGPIGDRRAERAAAQRARRELWDWFTARCTTLSVRGLGPVRRWPDEVRRDGVRGSVDDHRAHLAKVLDVLDRLDAVPDTGTPLAVLASDLFGDPHALDAGRPVARLVTGAIADAAGNARPSTAEEVRATWELVGVVPDPLSSSVLVIGLDVRCEHALAPMLRHHRDACEPVVLTLSQVQRWPIDPLASKGRALVVENPALIAAAAARRFSGPPIVCSSGRPSFAVVALCRQLGARGASVLQHADFDVAGVGITAWLSEHAGTTPWQMTADAYLATVAARRERPALHGTVGATPWDPRLAEAMNEEGVAVFEEEMAESLLDEMS